MDDATRALFVGEINPALGHFSARGGTERLLQQRRLWRNADHRLIQILDMSVRYKLNALGVLERHALVYATKVRHEAELLAGGAPDEVYDEVLAINAAIARDPHAWIRKTPLYKELLKRVKRGEGPIDVIE
jgi:hypothetical protein